MDAVISFATRMFAPVERDVRSRGIRYSTLLWLFLFGSVAGFVLEGLWCVATKGYWENRSSLVWGPFSTIYGIGAVAAHALSAFLRGRSLLVQFVAFTISGAVVEFLGSLFQELCFGSISWDYSAHALNLGGRISLRMALVWGILGVLFMRFVSPLVDRVFQKMRGNGWRIVCVGVTMVMLANILVSSAALTRWRTRSEGVAPANVVAQWLDETYDDETMERSFPNMRFISGTGAKAES